MVSIPFAASCRPGGDARPPTVTDLTVFDLPPDPPPSGSSDRPPLAKRPKATVAVELSEGDLSASSTYQGWPLANAVDGDEKTSWYSDTDDSVAKGRRPFIQITYRQPRPVRTVSILGNRDPAFFDGFAILRGQLDAFDADGRVVASLRADGTGDRRDYVFSLETTTPVKTLRFTSLQDEGHKNRWGDVAIAELRVE